MKIAARRIASGFLVAGTWLWAGAKAVLDAIGYAGIPQDAQAATGLLRQGLLWVLSLPWWVPIGCAFISTLFLIWVSWPRHHLSEPSAATKSPTPKPPETSGKASDSEKKIQDQAAKITELTNKLNEYQSLISSLEDNDRKRDRYLYLDNILPQFSTSENDLGKSWERLAEAFKKHPDSNYTHGIYSARRQWDHNIDGIARMTGEATGKNYNIKDYPLYTRNQMRKVPGDQQVIDEEQRQEYRRMYEINQNAISAIKSAREELEKERNSLKSSWMHRGKTSKR